MVRSMVLVALLLTVGLAGCSGGDDADATTAQDDGAGRADDGAEGSTDASDADAVGDAIDDLGSLGDDLDGTVEEATDTAGDIADTASSPAAANRVPTATLTTSGNVFPDAPATFTIEVDDADKDELSWELHFESDDISSLPAPISSTVPSGSDRSTVSVSFGGLGDVKVVLEVADGEATTRTEVLLSVLDVCHNVGEVLGRNEVNIGINGATDLLCAGVSRHDGRLVLEYQVRDRMDIKESVVLFKTTAKADYGSKKGHNINIGWNGEDMDMTWHTTEDNGLMGSTTTEVHDPPAKVSWHGDVLRIDVDETFFGGTAPKDGAQLDAFRLVSYGHTGQKEMIPPTSAALSIRYLPDDGVAAIEK